MDQHAISRALAGLPLGAVRYYPLIDSTNDEAARWAARGAPDLALVVADEQTSGRGRAGRRWYTPSGSALAFSLVLYPHSRAASGIPQATALGALSVQTALKESYALPAQIKWPNDVLIERHKVAGVLAEAHWVGDELKNFILGIGINIAPPSISWAFDEPSQADMPVTCVQDATGTTVDRLELLYEVLKDLLVWRSGLGTAEFIAAWEAALAFRDEWLMIYQGNPIHDAQYSSGMLAASSPSVLKGRILGLAEDGSLILRSPAGEIYKLHSGEVRVRPVLELEA